MLTGKSEETDRLPIVDNITFQMSLLEYVNSPLPLSTCSYCMGTVGIKRPHGQWSKAHLAANIDKTSEELVDYDWLERSLIAQDTYDDCKIPTRFGVSRALAKSPILQRLVRIFWPKHVHLDYLSLAKRPRRQSAAEARHIHLNGKNKNGGRWLLLSRIWGSIPRRVR
jgi:hypothetical protein